jgi:hypothetical protein
LFVCSSSDDELSHQRKGGNKTPKKHASGDLDPLAVQKVNFTEIGGLDDHIKSLKEMIILPLLYPEVRKCPVVFYFIF